MHLHHHARAQSQAGPPRSPRNALYKNDRLAAMLRLKRESKRSGLALLALLAAVASQITSAAAADWQLTDGARVHPAYQGLVPAKSEVVFSTRSKRDDAKATAKAFGATRIEWVYTADANFVSSLREVTPWFGGALNSIPPLPQKTGYALDFSGEPVVAPWMKAWGAKWVTTTSPETQKVIRDTLNWYLQQGAKSIQFDDPSLQAFSANYAAGDFNPSTMAGFKAWLSTNADQSAVRAAGLSNYDGDYRKFLRDRHGISSAEDYKRDYLKFPSTPLWLAYIKSTVDLFYGDLRKRLDTESKGKVSLSMNLTNFYYPDENDRAFFLTTYVDYLMSESDISNTLAMTTQVANARSLGIGTVPSIKPLDLARNRVAIATFYALGAPPVVPWDVYTGGANRYYGTPEQFGDIYGFARKSRAFLDDREATAVVGVAVAVDRYLKKETGDVIKRLHDRQIPFAFIPLGGRDKRTITAKQVQGYKVVVTVNVDEDYPKEDLRVIHQHAKSRLKISEVTDPQLAMLQPFIAAPGGNTLRFYPRASPNRDDQLILHLIDEARGNNENEKFGSCSRRIGIRKTLVEPSTVISAEWIPGPAAPIATVDPDVGKEHVFFSLAGCPLWGILNIRLKR